MTWWQDILKDFGGWLFLGGTGSVGFAVVKAFQKRNGAEITATQVQEDAAVVQSDQRIKDSIENYAGAFIVTLQENVAEAKSDAAAARRDAADAQRDAAEAKRDAAEAKRDADTARKEAARERAQSAALQAELEQARSSWHSLSDWVRDLLARWDEHRVHANPPSGANRYLHN